MNRSWLWWTCFALFVLFGVSSVAFAHPVVVDGVDSDWFGVAGLGFNVGRVARDATSRGEVFWLDQTGDTRTDLSGGGPEASADLTEVQVTASPTALCFILQTVSRTTPTQIQIAIDLDRVSGSGQSAFAGSADTTVAPEARWEFLLQSQLGGTPRVDLLDASFARTIGAASSAIAAGGLETCIDWTALGRTGPPAALRLTFATFREDVATGNTVDIGGPTVSNALDCVTDYADQPMFSANTLVEVMDGAVDHHMHVWLEGDGDVMAPLLIAAFQGRPGPPVGSGEWIQIRNVTASPLDLAGFKLGDEEQPTSGEGMLFLPAGVVLPPGGGAYFAATGGLFTPRYGFPPTALFSDLTPFTNWSSGAVSFNNLGDHSITLGPDNMVLDVANYGIGTYPGTTPMGDIQIDMPPVRIPAAGDTDDNRVDFTFRRGCSPAGCGSCASCAETTCAPFATGTSCADADLCNGAEACDAAGLCAPGTPLACDDGNPCTGDSCAAATGCTNPPSPAGTGCADADLCDGAETCDGAGACAAGMPLSCGDGNPCTTDSCVPATGCSNPPAAAGTGCADADLCDGAEACDGSGACAAGMPLVCNDGNPCTTDGCAAATGCTTPPAAAGTSCADADLCDGPEACDGSGSCAAAMPLDCDDGDVCTMDSCVPATGCDNPPEPEGTSCTDGDPCNGDETCDGAGACEPGEPIECDAGVPDAGPGDAGPGDAGPGDAGPGDAGPDAATDAGPVDAGSDAGSDAGPGDDAGPADAGAGDAGADDAGIDAGRTDDGGRDGAIDAGEGGGGGGCGCRALDGRGSRSDGILIVAVVIALVGLRRRRRR